MLQTTCIVKTFLVLNPLAALGSDNQQYSWLSRLSAAIGVQCEVYPDRTHKGLGLASLFYSSNNYSTFKIERWVLAQFIPLQGVMKKAVKWTSTSIDRRPTGKEQSGRRLPSKSAVTSTLTVNLDGQR